MIRKKVRFPILFFVVLTLVCSCKEEQNNMKGNYNALRVKAEAFLKKSQLDSAYFYFTKAKEACPDSTDVRRTYALYNMADIQQLVGDYYGSEETITEALVNEKDTAYKPYLYNMLGVAYDKQKNFDRALISYKKIRSISSDDTLRAGAQNNIGVIYLEKGQYQKSILVLQPLLTNAAFRNEKKKVELARVYDNLGYVKFKQNNPEAYPYLLKAFQLRDSIQDDLGLIASNMHLAEYFNNRDKPLAQQYASKALALAKKINSPDDKLEALRWLTNNSNPQTESRYASAYMRLDDSLSMARETAKNKFANIRFDSSNAIKNLEIQKGQKVLYLILFLSAIILGTVLYFLIRNRNREKLKTISYATETFISKRLHDELANDVYNTMTFAETQDLQSPERREILIDKLDKIYSRTRNISKENSTLHTDEKFEEELKEMMSSYISSNVSIIVKNINAIMWTKVASEKKIAIYRVLQELLVNMKKHSQATVVVIGFENKQHIVEVSYSDNGIGCPDMLKLKNGLQNAENRMETIKGKITFESEAGKGFRAKIIFPQ